MSGLTPAELLKCDKHKGEFCDNTIMWVVIVILVFMMLGIGGYLGYQYYVDNLCFRDDKSKQCAAKKV